MDCHSAQKRHSRRKIHPRSHVNNGQLPILLGQAPLNLENADVVDPRFQDQAARLVPRVGCKESTPRCVGSNRQPERLLEQMFDQRPYERIPIDYKNRREMPENIIV